MWEERTASIFSPEDGSSVYLEIHKALKPSTIKLTLQMPYFSRVLEVIRPTYHLISGTRKDHRRFWLLQNTTVRVDKRPCWPLWLTSGSNVTGPWEPLISSAAQRRAPCSLLQTSQSLPFVMLETCSAEFSCTAVFVSCWGTALFARTVSRCGETQIISVIVRIQVTFRKWIALFSIFCSYSVLQPR